MRRSGTRFFWKLYPSYLIVVLLSLSLAGWLVSGTIRRFYMDQVYEDLRAKAFLVMNDFRKRDVLEPKEVDRYCKVVGKAIGTRITVILTGGEVIGDSHKDPRNMDNHADRPEISEALTGSIGRSIRYSHTLKTEMMYVAVLLHKDDGNVAVVRASMPLDAVEDALGAIYSRLSAWTFVAALLAAILCFLISRRMSRPIEELTKQVVGLPEKGMAHEFKPPRDASKEIGILADALNRMTTELGERMKTVEEQRSRLDAILSSMSEGIVAVDKAGRIVAMNRAAGEQLDVDPDKAGESLLEESIRRHGLLELVKNVASSGQHEEIEIRMAGRILQAHGKCIKNSETGAVTGVLVVLKDVTELRKMEEIRKDFVANVSHELKTPITVIKGFAETLIDGAIKDGENAERFLNTILVNSDRMERIIQDLLTLSRMEQGGGEQRIEFTEVALEDVVREAARVCTVAAGEKKIEIRVDVPEGLMVNVNSRLVEQALVNLLDNAVKYSDPGKCVSVEGRVQGAEIVVSVRDQGYGIEKKEIPRIFERFYRVDKARSRKLGGTGLGLAIVKHVALIHGGRVEVQSSPGSGSVFSIHFPIGI